MSDKTGALSFSYPFAIYLEKISIRIQDNRRVRGMKLMHQLLFSVRGAGESLQVEKRKYDGNDGEK